MQVITKPPKEYKPKKNAAWCPYCGRETPFAWDGRVDAARCPECGVSARDYYTRVLNGLGKDKDLEGFEKSVKASGKKYAKPFSWKKAEAEAKEAPPAGDAGTPTATPPDKLEPLKVFCPACGSFIRALYPPAALKCSRCGSEIKVDRSGKASFRAPESAVRCRRCGELVTEKASPGTAYWCQRCGSWSALPGDRAGEKTADAEEREQRKRGSRREEAAEQWDPDPALERAAAAFPLEEASGEPRSEAWAVGESWFFWTESPAGVEAARALGLRKVGGQAGEDGRAAVIFAGPAEAVREALRAARKDDKVLVSGGLELRVEVSYNAFPEERLSGEVLPEPVLVKVKRLVEQECAYCVSFDRKRSCVRSGSGDCTYFTGGPHSCAWFERAVLPGDPALEEAYWKDYGQAAEDATEEEKARQVRKAAREVLKEAKKKREKRCETCKKFFVPAPGKEKSKYCSDICRLIARREQDRVRKQKEKELLQSTPPVEG